MEKDFKKKVIKPLCIYSLAFSMLLPSLTGVVEAASDLKESNTEKIVASLKEKTEEKKKEVQEDKTEVKEENTEEVLTKEEIEKIQEKALSLGDDKYVFTSYRVEELKERLAKLKEENPEEFDKLKQAVIDQAIEEFKPNSRGEDRAVKNFNIKDADKLEAGMTVINVRGLGMETGQIIEVLVNGEVKGTFTQPKSVKRSVKITISGVLKEGDKVKAILKGSNGVQIATTEEATAKKKEPTKAEKYKDTLKMPTGTIIIEDTASNLPDETEKEKALELFKLANTDIANDIKSIEFSIVGTTKAFYAVTYNDDSKSGKVEATELKIENPEENSQQPKIADTYVADGQITITLDKEIAAGSRIGIIQNIDSTEKDKFCSDKGTCATGNCKFTKTTIKEWVRVDKQTKTFTYKVDQNFLQLKKEFGVIVKEYGKSSACKKTEPQIKIPNVGVRDPKKLTEEEKKTIESEIIKANTTNDGKGVSKLPNGTGEYAGIPAIIDFDKDGNVKIINPSEVEGDWDNGEFVPKKKDGNVIVKDEDKVVQVKKKDLVTNLAPNQPKVGYDKKKGEITVTPDKEDTDAKTITVKYKDPEGTEKTETATKDKDGKWSVPEGSTIKVDETTGVVTIKDSDIQNKTDVSATVTDEGGIATNDKDEKTSDNKSVPIKISPKKPEIIVDNQDGSVTIKPIGRDKDRVAKKMVIGYSPADNREVDIVTVEIDENGNLTLPEGSDFKLSEDKKSITITNDKIKSNTKIKAITNDGDTDPNQVLESDESEENVPDKTAPKPPTVEVNTTDGTAHITPPSDPDVKTIEVKYMGSDGNEKTFTATKKDSGWEISGDNGVTFEMSGYISIPYNQLKKADTITATAKDGDGNVSKPGTDISLPPAPSVKLDEDKGVVTVTPPTDKAPAVDGMEITYTPATEGASETKLTAKKDNAGKWSIENIPEGITIDKNSGVVTITSDKAKAESKVIALSKIGQDKNSLEKSEVQVPDSRTPDAPEVKVQEDGSVKITPKNDIETSVTVTYNKEDGTPVTVEAKKVGGQWKIETPTNDETVDPNTGVITIPNGKTNPGDDVIAKAKKGSKISGPGQDFTKPAPPTVTPDQESGNVTITPPTKGNLDGMDIEYKTPDNTNRKVRVVKGTDKKWKIDGENPDVVTIDGDTGIVTIPKGKAKEKTEVVANSTKGGKKAPAEKTPDNQNLVPDKTAPNPPTVEVDTKTGNITITPPKDEDTTSVTVTYKKADNTEIKVKAKKVENKWSLTKEDGSPIDNEESVDQTSGVITLAKGKYKTQEEIKAYGNDNVDNKSSEDKQTPVEVTFEANGGSKTMDGSILALGKENKPQGQSAVLPAVFELPECKFAPPAGKEFAGWKVGDETKKAGDEIKINSNTTVKALWKDKASDKPGEGGSPGQDKPNKPEEQIPGIKIRDHYTPTFPVYVTVPKTEKVEKTEEVPVSLETHKAYIAGYEDNTLRAEGNLTRAEAAAMVTRLAGLDLSDTSMPAFKDMQKNAWYFRYINAAVKAKMLDADNGMMRPNDKITRAEFAKMLAAIDKENSSVSKFDDIKGHRYEKEINKIYGNNRIEGYEDGSFRPDAYLTRAESAAFLNRMFNRIADKEAYAGLEDKLAKFKDFDASKWYYDEMVEATNSHELTRRGKASDKFGRVYEKWTRILPSDVK